MLNAFEDIVKKVREFLGIPNDLNVDPIDALNRAMIGNYISGYQFVPDAHLPLDEARWDSESRTIFMRQSLEDGIKRSDANSRFTVFHELAHAILGHSKRNRKPEGSKQFGRYTEPDERDADDFAAEFSAPLHLALLLNIKTTDDFVRYFGIPESIADSRLVALEKLRRRQAAVDNDGEDSYGAAMHEMAINARNWNS